MFCGLDFGTSNSTIGVCYQGGCHLLPLEQGKRSIRSAIFCDNESNEYVFGQQGIDDYLEGYTGRLMMSLKSVLGSSLMDEKTVVFNQLISYQEILSHFVQHIKQQAEVATKTQLTQVVLGRPVRFHDDDDEKDKLAANTLESIVRSIGFKDIVFQYEPIAAALAYEATITEEQCALIIDMGGGTSDFTVIRLRPDNQQTDREQDVLSNEGIHIAGTDFDRRLSLKSVMPLLGLGSTVKNTDCDIEVPSGFYHDLTTWHTLHTAYDKSTIARVQSVRSYAHQKDLISRLLTVLQHRLGHHIMNSVESAKKILSSQQQMVLDLSFIETELMSNVQRDDLNVAIHEYVQKIINKVEFTVQQAGVAKTAINALFYTGGSTQIPLVRDKINALFPQAKIVQGDVFGSVGMGLTLEARHRFG